MAGAARHKQKEREMNYGHEEAEKINGIGIFCSDPRPEANLWKRAKKHLISPERRLSPILLLGGPVSLAYPEWLPTDFAFLINQLVVAMKKFPNAKEIIVAGHDCGYYTEIPPRLQATIAEKEKDIAVGAALLKRRFDLKVLAYFAKGGNDDGFKAIHF